MFIAGKNDLKQIDEDEGDIVDQFEIVEGIGKVERIFCSNFFAALDKEGNLYLWGGQKNSFCPYIMPTLLNEFEGRVLEVSLGDGFIVIVDSDLVVFTCGKND